MRRKLYENGWQFITINSSSTIKRQYNHIHYIYGALESCRNNLTCTQNLTSTSIRIGHVHLCPSQKRRKAQKEIHMHVLCTKPLLSFRFTFSSQKRFSLRLQPRPRTGQERTMSSCHLEGKNWRPFPWRTQREETGRVLSRNVPPTAHQGRQRLPRNPTCQHLLELQNVQEWFSWMANLSQSDQPSLSPEICLGNKLYQIYL